MSSTLPARIGYLKDRCVNAYWMLRRGEFGLMVKSAGVEFEHRYAIIQGQLRHQSIIFFRTLRISLHEGRQRLARSAHRGVVDDGIEQIHAVAEEVIPGSAFQNRRKVLPPSYQPTQSRLHTIDGLKADPQKLLAQLADIRKTVGPVKL